MVSTCTNTYQHNQLLTQCMGVLTLFCVCQHCAAPSMWGGAVTRARTWSRDLRMCCGAGGLLAQPSASYRISLCHTIPSGSQLLSCESHALTRMCRARTVTASMWGGAVTRARTWSRDLRMCCGAGGLLAQPSASYRISLCHTIPSGSQLLSCESHALTRMCRARTVTASMWGGAVTRARTWSRDLRMCCGAGGLLAQPSASYRISLCHTIPSGSQLLSCESHALTRMCRARTVTASMWGGAVTRARTWSRDLRMCCGAGGLLAQPSASYRISLCHTIPSGSQLLSCESHALTRMCRARTVTASIGAAQLLVHALGLET